MSTVLVFLLLYSAAAAVQEALRHETSSLASMQRSKRTSEDSSFRRTLAGACPAGGDSTLSVVGKATSTSSPATWEGVTTVSGGSLAAVWDLAPVANITVAPGGQAAISCVTLTSVMLSPPNAAAFGALSALQLSAPGVSQPPPLSLSQVVVQTDCSTVAQYQRYVCGIDVTHIKGAVQISSPSWLFVLSWESPLVVMSGVNITCSPTASTQPVAAKVVLPPFCIAAAVDSAASLLATADSLMQLATDTQLPVLLVATQDIVFTQRDVSPRWPYGLNITTNVTIASVIQEDSVLLDWADLLNVFWVNNFPRRVLTISGFLMVNLPIGLAPMSDPSLASMANHLFGMLQPSTWSISRPYNAQFPRARFKNATFLYVVSCRLVVAQDTFVYFTYWYTLGNSPNPDIAKLASWANIRQNATAGVGTDRVFPPDTDGFINVTFESPVAYPVNRMQTGLLHIADLGGYNYIPTINLFEVISLSDIIMAVAFTVNNYWTTQYGQIMVVSSNMTGLDAGFQTSDLFYMAETVAPVFTPAAVTAALPLTLQTATTLTTWPNVSTCWDFQRLPLQVLCTTAKGQLDISSLALFNLPQPASAEDSAALPITKLLSALWPFRLTNRTNTESIITLRNVTLHVPFVELQLYFQAASLTRGGGPGSEFRLSDAGRIIMGQWISSQLMTSNGDSWIYYESLATAHFHGVGINITCAVPPACARFTPNDVDVSYSDFLVSQSTSGSSTSLPPWAIAVIVVGGVLLLSGAAVALFVVVRARVAASQHWLLFGSSRRSSLVASSKAQLMGQQQGSDDGVEVLDATLLKAASNSNSSHKPAGVSTLLVAKSVSSDGEGKESVSVSSLAIRSDSFEEAASAGGNMMDDVKKKLPPPPPSPLSSNSSKGLHALTTARSSQGAAPPPDEQLELFEVLGHGGMGIVYRGLWKGLPVAAKVMVMHEERQEQAQRQMLEANMSLGLSHPNIVITYMYDLKRMNAQGEQLETSRLPTGITWKRTAGRSVATAWQLVILQELCKGGTLHHMIADGLLSTIEKGVPVPNMQHVLQLALDIACGLEHLHLKNIVHSDMTPNNVLLQEIVGSPRPAGLHWTAKVADFGLSVAFEEGRSHVSHTFRGTPHYIAPETQFGGILSKPSDVFAFGILLHELVTSSVPRNKQTHRPITKAAAARLTPEQQQRFGPAAPPLAGPRQQPLWGAAGVPVLAGQDAQQQQQTGGTALPQHQAAAQPGGTLLPTDEEGQQQLWGEAPLHSETPVRDPSRLDVDFTDSADLTAGHAAAAGATKPPAASQLMDVAACADVVPAPSFCPSLSLHQERAPQQQSGLLMTNSSDLRSFPDYGDNSIGSFPPYNGLFGGGAGGGGPWGGGGGGGWAPAAGGQPAALGGDWRPPSELTPESVPDAEGGDAVGGADDACKVYLPAPPSSMGTLSGFMDTPSQDDTSHQYGAGQGGTENCRADSATGNLTSAAAAAEGSNASLQQLYVNPIAAANDARGGWDGATDVLSQAFAVEDVRTSSGSGGPEFHQYVQQQQQLQPAGNNTASPILMGGGRGRHGPPNLLAPMPPCCPPAFVELVGECLRPIPSQRPTVSEVRRRLGLLVAAHVTSLTAHSSCCSDA